ncbi:hypothetical protein RHSIM_Rhsim05G0118000 [Rhododendron simsii]|uniref:Squamous cell carcinoma antigen recognized by T-cells 3 n=1 Tax=Rhododendron simsii TaxID=118357 RepID=A0A834LMD5_RHOSS|nr:hypothetical protein RHSIM_Rhsim05G0118000 [Rhododendron simsii]
MDETLVPSDPQPTDEVMNEVQQNPNKNPSESESDSDDSDDEAQQTVQIETLEIELANNPANYDAHVQYIRALRKKGDIEKLRKAREAMSELFPLSPAMWQDWAKDEASLGSGSESFPEIEKLYECGVFDYLSVSLWCDYLNFVQEHEPSVRECSPVGILKARDLFERALTAAGLHVAEGHRIWEAYREFEQAIFHTIDATDVEAREKQIQRIRHIFHRQMSIPHVGLRSTLVAYKSWEAEHGTVPDANSGELDGVSSYVASAYRKALEMLNARVLFEERVSRLDAPDVERLQEYMDYLKFEQSSGDPARVQLLYERAVTEFPISNALWFDYTRYMDSTFKASSIVRDVYLRATKNCPWVGELWVRYLLSLERGRASEKEISAVFEKSILCTFSSFDEYLDIFLTRVDGLRRKISQAGEVEDALDYAVIRDTFQRASDYLSPHLKDMDGLLRIHSYWARLESSLGKDLVAARGVWESLLKISGSMLNAWKGYITMETEMGNINEARSLYRRCYSKRFPGTGSEDICHSWLRFEREFGTLEDFDRAIQKLTPRLEELQLFRLQPESKNVGLMTNQRENVSKRNTPEKRKQGSNVGDEQPKAKRQKNTAPDMRKAKGEDKSREKSSVETKRLENTQVNDGKSSSAHGKETKDLTPVKLKYKDQCTAFVSNLGYQASCQLPLLRATYDDLRGFFSDVGGGLAYVDFADDAHLEAAVAKNKRTLLGKRLSIARSDPKQRKTRESLGRHAPVEHVGESGPKEDKSDTSQGATGGHDPESTNPHNDGDNIQLKGKNTFAVPRTVRPLGWTDKNNVKMEVAEEGEDEKPKSNDEFRKMLLRK